jgi:hypothetical protein
VEPVNVKRLFAEGGVIVVSILAAFAVDAWWESRQEQEAAQWLVDRLYSDFKTIRTDLDTVMRDHERALEATTKLSELEGPMTLTGETAQMLFDVFIGFRTFNPGSGSVEVFLNSDASRMVENQPLADLLIRWPSVVDEMREDEAMLPAGVQERWRPYLASKMDLRVFMGGREPAEVQPLIADAEFFSHVSDRLIIQQVIVRDMQLVSNAVDQILAILATEVE